MKCLECKWYAGQANDSYGVCKRYPQIVNKNQHDWCGEFFDKVEIPKISIKFEEPTEYEAPKRGRKPKA